MKVYWEKRRENYSCYLRFIIPVPELNLFIVSFSNLSRHKKSGTAKRKFLYPRFIVSVNVCDNLPNNNFSIRTKEIIKWGELVIKNNLYTNISLNEMMEVYENLLDSSE